MKNQPIAPLVAAVLLLLGACSPKHSFTFASDPSALNKPLIYRQTTNSEVNTTLPGGEISTTYSTEITDFQYTLRHVRPNGSSDWEMRILRRQTLENQDGKVAERDSNQPGDTSDLKIKMEQTLTRQLFTFSLTPDGSLTRMSGLDSVWAVTRRAMEGDPQKLQILDDLTQSMTDEKMGQLYGQMWAYVPPKPVKKGQKWTHTHVVPPFNLALQSTYRLRSFSPERADIELSTLIQADEDNPGKLKAGPLTLLYYLGGSGGGHLEIDPGTGLLRRSEQQSEMSGRMVVKLPFLPGQKVPMQVKTKVTVERVN